ncbi:LamG domain-containing protein [Candidatus Poribacteria bacterium]|nr:LamG domain-containing protein [Candidatus Poribacteria bacterium]MYB64936.1 LamG domain-containing protein [Candidatus Poribacteria bacterium]MYF55574.1 LamG domain-containing protein [Candidatus Poribacteria bacterium]
MYKLTLILILTLLAFSPNLMAVTTEGLVGAWLLDDGTGTTVADSSGNKLDGEVSAGTPAWVEGKFDGALEFGGSDMVTIPDNDALDLTSFTIAAWIKSPATTGRWHVIAAKEARNPTGRNYGIFGHVNNGSIHYSFTSGGWKSFDAPTNVTDGAWHHVAATYERPNFKLYIDGELDAEQAPDAVPESNDSPLYIGGCNIGNYWMTGTIDEVVLYDRALSPAEIGELIQEGIATVTPVEPAGKLATTWSQIKTGSTK